MIRKQQRQVKVACAKGWRMHISPHGAACASSSAGLGEIAKRTFLPDCQCFAGDNRSSAALVVWLVFQHHMTASEGIRLLLQARPTLNPWQERPHILWALKTWEMRREETHHFIQSMVVEKMPRLTPDLIRSALGSGLKVTLPIQVSTRLNYLQRFQHSDGTPAPAEPRPKTVPRQAWEMAGQSYRQKRTKHTFVEPVRFQACWWIMASSWEAFQTFYMDDAQVPPLTNGEPKHGPSYKNVCKTHAVRFANWDHRWLASLTADCSAVLDVVTLVESHFSGVLSEMHSMVLEKKVF